MDWSWWSTQLNVVYLCDYGTYVNSLSGEGYKYNVVPPLPAQLNLTPPPTLYPQQPMSASENYSFHRFSPSGSPEIGSTKPNRADINVWFQLKSLLFVLYRKRRCVSLDVVCNCTSVINSYCKVLSPRWWPSWSRRTCHKAHHFTQVTINCLYSVLDYFHYPSFANYLFIHKKKESYIACRWLVLLLSPWVCYLACSLYISQFTLLNCTDSQKWFVE